MWTSPIREERAPIRAAGTESFRCRGGFLGYTRSRVSFPLLLDALLSFLFFRYTVFREMLAWNREAVSGGRPIPPLPQGEPSQLKIP